jgi:hypothetical protein
MGRYLESEVIFEREETLKSEETFEREETFEGARKKCEKEGVRSELSGPATMDQMRPHDQIAGSL